MGHASFAPRLDYGSRHGIRASALPRPYSKALLAQCLHQRPTAVHDHGYPDGEQEQKQESFAHVGCSSVMDDWLWIKNAHVRYKVPPTVVSCSPPS